MGRKVNEVDVDVLGGTVAAFKQDEELGRSRFRARNRWQSGAKNLGTIDGYYALKRETPHARSFEVKADEPPFLAGDDSAPNPVEHLLAALAACLTTSLVAHAAVRGIAIDAVESEVEGDIDLNGFMGLKPKTPRGYQQIRVRFSITSDAPAEQLETLARFSPVFNTIADGAAIDLRIDATPAPLVREGGAPARSEETAGAT